MHFRLNKFRIKSTRLLHCFRSQVFLNIQAILPETCPFLSAQMALLSSFFQMFIALGMYNFGTRLTSASVKLLRSLKMPPRYSKRACLGNGSMQAHTQPIGVSFMRLHIQDLGVSRRASLIRASHVARLRLNDGAKLWISFKHYLKTTNSQQHAIMG